MKITTPQMGLKVECPQGGFVSRRMLLAADGMGYSITHTTVKAGLRQIWHYKNHLESCYCLKGYAHLKDLETGVEYTITPGVMYVLNEHDRHEFFADTETELICVFNPPLKGSEVHQQDGSYAQ
jgi:L-ectoine synthase